MNYVDLALLAVMLVSVIYGLYKGFVSSLLSLCGLFGSWYLSYKLYPLISQALFKNQVVMDTLAHYVDMSSKISNPDVAVAAAESVDQGQMAALVEQLQLPEVFSSAIEAVRTGAMGLVQQNTVADMLNQSIVYVGINVLSFLLVFLVSYIVISFITALVRYVFKFPVLKQLDGLAGGLFGLARGFLIVFLLFAVVPVAMSLFAGDSAFAVVQQAVDQSAIGSVFYNSNLLSSILSSFGG